MSLWGWWFSEKNPIYRGGQRVGQRAYETGYSTGRLITGQTPPPSYPGGEYQDTTPASEYAEQYGGTPPSGGEGAGAAESAEARRRRERREEQQRREEERRRNVMVIPTVTVGLGGGVGAITPVISKLFSPIIRAGEFVGAEAKRAGEWAAGYDAYSRAAAVMLPSYEAQLGYYEAQGAKYTGELKAAEESEKGNIITMPTGEQVYETEEWRQFQRKWEGKIRGTTFLGTQEEYESYMAEREQAETFEQAALESSQQKFAALEAQYGSLNAQYQSLEKEYGTFEQLEAGAKIKQQERFWGVPVRFGEIERSISERPFFKGLEFERQKMESQWLPQAEAALYLRGMPALVHLSQERTLGQLEGITQKPLTAAAWFGATTVITAVAPYAGIAAKALVGPIPRLGALAINYGPKLIGSGLMTGYAASIGIRLYQTPPSERARAFGRLETTEFMPMTAGYIAGVKLPQITKAAIEAIPYRIHYGKPPEQLLIEMGKMPVGSTKTPTTEAIVRPQTGLKPEGYVTFMGKPQRTTFGMEPEQIHVPLRGAQTTTPGKPMTADMAPLYVRPPRSATAGILERFSFTGKPGYVTTGYGSYIKVSGPTRTPDLLRDFIQGGIVPTGGGRQLWISRMLDITPAKMNIRFTQPRVAIPQWTPDTVATPFKPVGQTWEGVVGPAGDIELAYPTFAPIISRVPTTAFPVTETPLTWGELSGHFKPQPFIPSSPGERFTIEDLRQWQPEVTTKAIVPATERVGPLAFAQYLKWSGQLKGVFYPEKLPVYERYFPSEAVKNWNMGIIGGLVTSSSKIGSPESKPTIYINPRLRYGLWDIKGARIADFETALAHELFHVKYPFRSEEQIKELEKEFVKAKDKKIFEIPINQPSITPKPIKIETVIPLYRDIKPIKVIKEIPPELIKAAKEWKKAKTPMAIPSIEPGWYQPPTPSVEPELQPEMKKDITKTIKPPTRWGGPWAGDRPPFIPFPFKVRVGVPTVPLMPIRGDKGVDIISPTQDIIQDLNKWIRAEGISGGEESSRWRNPYITISGEFKKADEERERGYPFVFPQPHPLQFQHPYPQSLPQSYPQPQPYPNPYTSPLPQITPQPTPDITPYITPEPITGPWQRPGPGPGPGPTPPPPPPPSPIIILPFGEGKYERKKKKPRRKQWEWKETWQVPTPQQLIGKVPGVIKAGPGIPTVSQAQMLERMPKNIYKRRG